MSNEEKNEESIETEDVGDLGDVIEDQDGDTEGVDGVGEETCTERRTRLFKENQENK